VRRYPIDLTDSMPLTLSPGEEVFLGLSMPGSGELVAQAEDGSLARLELSKAGSRGMIPPIDEGNRYRVEYGRYDMALKNGGERVRNYQLQFTPGERLAGAALPAIDERLLERPEFPQLGEGRARYLDLKAGQWASFNVSVDEPGLYKLESTGLLQTRGNVRTRVITRLDQQANNGVGRNFLIQQYLREGNYQLTLAPEGNTAGHLGVQLSKTSLIDGGKLADGVAARYSLQSGAGLVYRFEIAETGQYRLRSFGSNGYFNARLEDSDGWPLVRPGIESNLDMELQAGNYRLVVLPTALSARVVTLLERVPEPVEYEGHGPFALDLNRRSYRHTWMEPAEGEARHPDVWTFELPAPAEISLRLSDGMEATVSSLDAGFDAQTFSDSRPLSQTLPAGRYRVEARARRSNNRLDYSLQFSIEELVVGQQRSIEAPAEIDISVGRAALIELDSFGQNDVRAKLFDADGKLVASNDDRANDWNFDIIRSLPTGRYRLAVRPVGKASAQTTIRMSQPKSLATKALRLPAEFSVDGPLIHSYGLDMSSQSGVLAVAAESRDSVSLTLEKRDGNGDWRSLAAASGAEALLLAAIDNTDTTGDHYWLKIWSPEQRGAEISIHASLVESRAVDEAGIRGGLKLTGRDMLSTRLAAVQTGLGSPGMFSVAPPLSNSLFWSPRKDRQLQPYAGYISSEKNLWLVSLDPEQPLKASRVLLEDQTLLVNIGGGADAWLDAARDGNADELVIAEARNGLPGIGLLENKRIDARQMGAGYHSSVLLARREMPGDVLRLKLWNTGADENQLPVRLRRLRFDASAATELERGVHDAALAANAALRFKLDGAPNDLRFNLPQGAAAVLSRDGKILRSLWADRGNQSHRLWSDADRLQVFNTTAIDLVFNIRLDRTKSLASLSRGQMFIHHFPSSGRFSLALGESAPAGSHAEVYGDRSELLAQDSTGRVARGVRVPLEGDALISLEHGVGLVVVWISDGQNYDGDGGAGRPLPERIELDGVRQTVDFERGRAGFVDLQSAVPLIARIQRNALADSVRVFETGIGTSLFLPRGKSRLQLQSITPEGLSGELRLAPAAEVELAEGQGDSVGLLPGDSRIYRFTLEQQQDIGIGVQASIDAARAYLYSQRGEILGEGVTQKHLLDPGTYYLRVELPPGADSGVDMRPAIVGLAPRDTGPSKEIMLEYQQYSQPEAL
jgi:hypothetical protein